MADATSDEADGGAGDGGVRRGWLGVGAEDDGAAHHFAVEQLERQVAIERVDQSYAHHDAGGGDDSVHNLGHPLVGLQREVADAPGIRHRAVGCGLWASGSGHWALGIRQWAVGSGQWAVGSGQWAVGSGHCLA